MDTRREIVKPHSLYRLVEKFVSNPSVIAFSDLPTQFHRWSRVLRRIEKLIGSVDNLAFKLEALRQWTKCVNSISRVAGRIGSLSQDFHFSCLFNLTVFRDCIASGLVRFYVREAEILSEEHSLIFSTQLVNLDDLRCYENEDDDCLTRYFFSNKNNVLCKK